MFILDFKEPKDYSFKVIPTEKSKIKPSSIDIEMLEKALQIMACIVSVYGKQYLPIFIRLHNEIKKRESDSLYETIALQMAKNKE